MTTARPEAIGHAASRSAEARTGDEYVPARIVPARHPGRWVAAGALVVLLAWVVDGAVRNPALDWPTVRAWFTAQAVVSGLYLTLWLTVVVMALAFVLGTVLALMRLSRNPVLSGVSWCYVWLFRSVPVLVQLLFWFNLGALYRTISLGVPFGPRFVTWEARDLIGALTAAVIGLTLHEAAYLAEIVRAGILSVDPGQTEAAQALGLSRWRTFRRVVLPQAMRAIVPPFGNAFIGTLKGTSIVSVIAVPDLLYSAQIVYNRTYQVIPLLVVATIWYIVVTSVLGVIQHVVERRFARGHDRAAPPRAPGRLSRLRPGRARSARSPHGAAEGARS